MQWVKRGVLWMVAAGALAATAPRAPGQVDMSSPDTTATDSLAITAPAWRFAPLYKSTMDGTVSYVSLLNQFTTSMGTPFGPAFDVGLSKQEKHFRLNTNREESKRLTLSGFHPFRFGLIASLGYSDSRAFSRYGAVGGTVQEYIFNDNGFNTGLTYQKVHPGFRYDAAANASVMNGERIYKTDETQGGGVNGGVAANFFRNRVVVQARGALRETSETSRTTLSVFDGLGASEDSVSSVVRVSLLDSIDVRVEYAAYNGVRDYADQLQGALGGQLPGVENVQEEHEVRSTRATKINLNSQLWAGFFLKLDASHDDQESSYTLQPSRFSHNIIDAVTGSVQYRMPWATTASVTFDNTETGRDLGPQSNSSLDESRKRAGFGVSHSFTQTLQLSLSASTQLTQTFYRDPVANPRDRDQQDNLARMTLTSQPFTPVSANITLAYASTRFLNIDASQSRNNRLREQFELGPGFSWMVRDWVTISQTYRVVIEHTEYDFVPEDNFLDRNLIFTNQFAIRPMERVKLRLDYRLYLHDKGAYLPTGPEGEEILNVETEDRRDQMGLRMDYSVNERITIFADNQYSQFVDRTVSSGVETTTTDGQISVGTTGAYTWNTNGKLSFQLVRVQRFSPRGFGSEREKNYWDMRAELNLPL